MRLRLPLAALAAVLLGFAASSAGAGPTAQDVALASALRTRRIHAVKFEQTKLADVVKWLRVATGLNWAVKVAALQKAGIELDTVVVDAQLDDVTIATLIDVILVPSGIHAKVEGNVVWLTSKADAAGKPVTRLYGISHITWTKVDFIAPDVNLHPSDYTPPEEYTPERVVETDPLTSGDAVVELVKEMAAPGEWDTEGWSIRATDRYLVVRAPLSVQGEVQKALRIVAALK